MATFSNYNNWGTADTTVGLKVTNSAPLDRRFVVDTFSNISKVVPKAYRYPGLRIFVMDEEKEYWYKSGVNSSNLVEYHPEAMFVESDLQDVDTSKLTVGAEITIFDNEGTPTKYVWNGTAWKPLVREVGGNVTTPIITNVGVDTYEELEALINGHVQANDLTVTAGTEIPIIFTDTAVSDKNADLYNKYVYLSKGENSHWYLETGTQTFEFSVPQELRTALSGTIISDDSNTSAKYVKYVKTTDGVDVVIEHNFCLQYVDVSVYRKGSSGADIDGDRTEDSDYGQVVYVPGYCVKSEGVYKVVISFFYVPDEGERFVAVLQR